MLSIDGLDDSSSKSIAISILGGWGVEVLLFDSATSITCFRRCVGIDKQIFREHILDFEGRVFEIINEALASEADIDIPLRTLGAIILMKDQLLIMQNYFYIFCYPLIFLKLSSQKKNRMNSAILFQITMPIKLRMYTLRAFVK